MGSSQKGFQAVTIYRGMNITGTHLGFPLLLLALSAQAMKTRNFSDVSAHKDLNTVHPYPQTQHWRI